MNFGFRAATAAVTSLCAIGVLSTCAPTTSVWAKSLPARVSANVSDSLLPASVSEAAAVEAETLTPVEFPVVVTKANKTVAETGETETAPVSNVRAQSLSQLVARHGATSTANREAECLAGAVYFESKGEPLDGQLAVAKVILNRAKSGRFPGSACSVVFQPGQFSFVRGGGFPPIARSSQMWKTAVAIAHVAKNDLWDSSVSNALFFHARRVSPGWKLKRIAAVGNHIFYR